MPGFEAQRPWTEGRMNELSRIMPRTHAVRVLIVDSELALAEAVAESLSHEPVVSHAQAADGPAAAARALDAERVDVVVVALDCDCWDAAAFVGDLSLRSPAPVIVAMSGVDDLTQATAAVAAGAVSWVSKQAGVREFIKVIRAAAGGEASVPPAMLMQVLRRLSTALAAGQNDSVAVRLSNRERQILEYTAQGLSRRQIADRLRVSVNTVRTHSQHCSASWGCIRRWRR
jgi:DNA-binding NarL/FixJ family response regulator